MILNKFTLRISSWYYYFSPCIGHLAGQFSPKNVLVLCNTNG